MSWYEIFRREYRHVKPVLPISIPLSVIALGWALTYPIFSIRINSITNSLELSGLIFAIWSMVSLVLDVPFGVKSDKVNKKTLLQLSLLGYVAVGYLYTVVDSLIPLIILRIIHPVIGCFFWISSWSIIRELSDRKHREEDTGFYTMVRSAAEMVGPLVGAWAVVVFSWRMPFYMLSLTALLAAFMVSRIKDVPKYRMKPERVTIRKEMSDFFGHGRYAFGLLFGIVILFTVATAIGTFLPIILDEGAFSMAEIGIILSVAMTLPWVLLPMPLGTLSDRYGRRPAVLIGMFLVALGFLVFNPAMGFWPTMVSSFIITTGFCVTSVTLNTIVGDMAHRGEYGGFTGMTEMPKDFAGIIGPIVMGFSLQIMGVLSTSFAFAAVCLVSIPILALTTK